MPRLSIVIPSLGNSEALETTLVSVLENRPRSCEVLVVVTSDYADPYQLKDEVRFIEAAPKAGLIERLTAGIQAADAPVVHLLAAGVEVTEGWVDAALPHFGDRHVAAVSPALVQGRQRQLIASGVKYSAGGVRKLEAAAAENKPAAPAATLGPTMLAAFYRRSTLDLIGSELSAQVGDHLADVELALTLKHAGFRCVHEPACRVYAAEDVAPPRSAFRRGLLAERLFWRSAPMTGWVRALALHPLVVLGEFTANLPRPRALAQLGGRLWGVCQFGSHLRHHRRLRELRRSAKAESSVEAPVHLRLDTSHGGRRSTDPQNGRGQIKRCG